MGCRTSLCSESEFYMTQELQKDSIDKSTNFYHTDISERFLDIKQILSSILSSDSGSVEIALDWLNEISLWIDENSLSPEDTKSTISISSNSEEIFLKHEFDFVKSFSPVSAFAKRHRDAFKASKFAEFEENLLSLGPLSIIFYLKLGSNFDCGIGIEKPLDSKQLIKFLSFSTEKQSILLWSGSLIPTAFYYSAFSTTRSLQFYIFDGHKAQNYLKGISLFEFFGAPLDKSHKEEVMKFKSEAVTASIELDEQNIISMGLLIHSTSNAESLLSKLQKPLLQPKPINFQSPDKISISLSSKGFEICKVYLLSNMLIFN